MKQFIDHLLKQEGISLTQHCRETGVSRYYVNLLRNRKRTNYKARKKVANSFGFDCFYDMQAAEWSWAYINQPKPNYYKRQKFIDRVLSFLGVR